MAGSDVTKRLEVPGSPGEYIEVRMLGWYALKEAREARVLEVIRHARAMGGELMVALRAEPSTGSGNVVEADPLEEYSLLVLLEHGVASWTRAEALTPDALKGLDEATAKWAGRAILEYSTPASGDALKNSSEPSTAI